MTGPLYDSQGNLMGAPPKKHRNPTDWNSLRVMIRNSQHRRRRKAAKRQRSLCPFDICDGTGVLEVTDINGDYQQPCICTPTTGRRNT